jgi:broad specificity phosphatase PhoE
MLGGSDGMRAPGRTVIVVRHGRTGYTQGNRKFASVAEAPDDLLEVGLPTLVETGQAIAKFRPRRILSSPTARTLHTSRVVREAAGLGEMPVQLEEELREIDNYNRGRFLAAVENMRGQALKDISDAELSQIFVSDELHDRVKELSPEHAAFVNSVEISAAAKERAFRVLQRSQDGDVLVTHDGIACQFVRTFTDRITLTRGKYIVLQERDAGWSIVETNDDSINLTTTKAPQKDSLSSLYSVPRSSIG